jgi:hypothetical protein
MGQLQARNPQMASQINQAMNSGTDPQALMRQMMGNMDNSQMQQVLGQAKNMGVPDNILNQIQNMK